MGEAGWAILAACALFALVGIQLGARFAKVDAGSPPAQGVTSLNFGDYDLLLFQSQGQLSGEEVDRLRAAVELCLEGGDQKRARFVVLPPGWALNVLHLKRGAPPPGGSEPGGKELVGEQG